MLLGHHYFKMSPRWSRQAENKGGEIKQLEVERARGRHEVYNETMETVQDVTERERDGVKEKVFEDEQVGFCLWYT